MCWLLCFCDRRRPWISWWRRIWKPTWPAGTFRNTSKRILSLSTLNIFINDPPPHTLLWQRREGERDSCVAACFWSHTLMYNKRTFRALLNMGSRDKWSHSRDVSEPNAGSTSQSRPSHGWGVGGCGEGVYTLTRHRKRISRSRLVQPWANEPTKAEARYLRMYIYHWLEAGARQTSCIMFLLDSPVTCGTVRRITAASCSITVWTESQAVMGLIFWYSLAFFFLFCF